MRIRKFWEFELLDLLTSGCLEFTQKYRIVYQMGLGPRPNGPSGRGVQTWQFKVRYAKPFAHERYDDWLVWKDIQATNAYAKYRSDHPGLKLKESTRVEVEGSWSDSDSEESS